MPREAVYMPKLGMTMTDGVIVEWMVEVGDVVAIGDEIVAIETEKVETVIEADTAGVVVEIIAEAEAEVEVGAIIAYLEAAEHE